MKKKFLKIISIALSVVLCCVFLPTQIMAETEIDSAVNEDTGLFFDFQSETRPSEITGTYTIVDDPVSEFNNDKVLRKTKADVNVNYVFKANTTYKIKFDYYMEVAEEESLPWIDLKVNTWDEAKGEFTWQSSLGSVKGWGSYTANQWNHIEFTYAPTSDKNPLMFKQYANNAMYIDNLSISVVSDSVSNGNTAISQSYDFDNIDFASNKKNQDCSVGLAANANGLKTLVRKFDGTSRDSEIIAKLDYPLVEGKYYKLSYDYNGGAGSGVSVYQSANGATNRSDACPTDVLNRGNINDIYAYNLRDSGGVWKTYDTIFYAKQTSNYIGILVPKNYPALSIDNIKIEECDTEGSTVTAFTTGYKLDFENTSLDTLGVSATASFEIVSDPCNPENKVLKFTGNRGSSLFLQKARLAPDHEYEITYDIYVPDTVNRHPQLYRCLRAKDGTKIDDSGLIWYSVDEWRTKNLYKVTATGGEYLEIFLNNNVGYEAYIDNIEIRDVTPIIVDSYYADYENEEPFIEDATLRAKVTYENDDEHGKVAKITYAPRTNEGVGGLTRFPVKLLDGEAYKVTFTYKTSAWATVAYGAKADSAAAKWGIDSRTWKTVTYYITGTGANDYFGFRCNNATEDLNIWIADVSIERKTNTTDLNADGLSDNTDLSLLRNYLLNGRNDLKMFEKFTEQNGVEGVNICDLVAFSDIVAQ